MIKRFGAGLLIASVFAASVPAVAADQSTKPNHTASEAATNQQALVAQAQQTAKTFAQDPGIDWVRRNVGSVKGVFIVPEQVKGAFMVGGAGGSGVMLTHMHGTWSNPAFYTMGSVSFGFQAGGEVSEIMLLVMTEKGLNAFKGTSVKLGGDVSVAAGPVGAGAKAATADILAFSRQKGLYGGVSVEGAVISSRDEWNKDYYGKAVTPAQILFTKGAVNPDAEPLRKSVAEIFVPLQKTGQLEQR